LRSHIAIEALRIDALSPSHCQISISSLRFSRFSSTLRRGRGRKGGSRVSGRRYHPFYVVILSLLGTTLTRELVGESSNRFRMLHVTKSPTNPQR
jgi:hypothetical protein